MGHTAMVLQVLARGGVDDGAVEPMDRHGSVTASQEHVVEGAHQRHCRATPMPVVPVTLGSRVVGLPKRQARRELGRGVGFARQDDGAPLLEHQGTKGLVARESIAQAGHPMGCHLGGMCAQPACARGAFTVLCGRPVWRPDGLRGHGHDLRLSRADEHRGDGGMRREGLASAALTGETGGAMHGRGRTGVRTIQGHQPWVAKDPKGCQHAVLFKARTDLNNHRIEMGRRDRIEQRAALMVTGNRLSAQEGLGVLVPFGVLQPALILQKRRRLGEKEAKGTQGSIVDGVSGVGSLVAMVRQWSAPSVQDALEDIEASRVCHDALLRAVESVTFALSVSIGNREPFASQNENC